MHNITLYGRVPSKKNSKRRIQRGQHIFMVPSAAHEAWHAEQIMLVRQWWKNKDPLAQVENVHLLFFPADRRKADLSNKAESIMDLLVDAGVLKDDSWFVVPKLSLEADDVDAKNPRVSIVINLMA